MNNRAGALRKNRIDAEIRLWHFLRDRRMAGCKFRRRHAIATFVVDFACLEGKLIVAADGGQYADRVSQDQQRTAFLEAQGFRVLRCWNKDVLANENAVRESILLALIGAPSLQPAHPNSAETQANRP